MRANRPGHAVLGGNIFLYILNLWPMANPPQAQTQTLGLNYHLDSVCLPSLVIRYFILSRKCVGENKWK